MKYPSQFLLVFRTTSTPPSLSNIGNSFPGSQNIPQMWQDDLKGFEYQKNLQLVFHLSIHIPYENKYWQINAIC